MSRHFIVGTSHTTNEETKAVQKWLDDYECGWWHWIDGMWLITEDSDELTTKKIRDEFRKRISREKRIMVFEVSNDIDWAGFGPAEEKGDMFAWMHNSWDESTE